MSWGVTPPDIFCVRTFSDLCKSVSSSQIPRRGIAKQREACVQRWVGPARLHSRKALVFSPLENSIQDLLSGCLVSGPRDTDENWLRTCCLNNSQSLRSRAASGAASELRGRQSFHRNQKRRQEDIQVEGGLPLAEWQRAGWVRRRTALVWGPHGNHPHQGGSCQGRAELNNCTSLLGLCLGGFHEKAESTGVVV